MKKLAVAIVPLAGVLLWYFEIKPGIALKLSKDSILQIQEGIVAFQSKFSKSPTNLSELVSANIMPAKSKIFSSPFSSLVRRTQTFQESDYYLYKENDFVIVSLKPEIIKAVRTEWRYKHAAQSMFSDRVHVTDRY